MSRPHVLTHAPVEWVRLHTDGGGCRAITSDNRRPALKLLDALQRGIGISVPGFASTWLYFSHPQRDEHFRSKFVLAALALLITTMCNASMLLDLLSYFAEWRRKGFHIIVMVCLQSPPPAEPRMPLRDA